MPTKKPTPKKVKVPKQGNGDSGNTGGKGGKSVSK